jgi:DNA polymerase-4
MTSTNRDRSIVHLNIADFAVAVERVIDSRLRDRPVVIAPQGLARAAVYDMSEEAYQAGVRKHMLLRHARRLCREARILTPHPHRYERAMQTLLQKALPYSPLVETGEDDGHLFLDVTGTTRLFGPPIDAAWRLSRQIRVDLGFDPIWSLAPNKLLAKVASRLVKPTGEYVVAAGEEQRFLAPLPLWLLPGIERDDLQRLQAFNLTQASHVTALSLAQLQIPFGKRAQLLYEAARGIDPSPVIPVEQKPPVARAEHEFAEDTNDVALLEGALYRLVEMVGTQLRQHRLAARRLRLVLDYSDGLRHARSTALNPATANDPTLFAQARPLLSRTWVRRVRIRHIRLLGEHLTFPPAQLDLFADRRRRQRKEDNLMAAIDRIRTCFGPDALRVGRTLPVAHPRPGQPVPSGPCQNIEMRAWREMGPKAHQSAWR